MGIFDFFKKITRNKVEEIEKEKVAFSGIRNWIENKTKENEIKEKEIFVLVNEKISVFTDEIKEKVRVLESVDIESRKVEERVKSLVNENRKKYIESVETFIENLNNLENDKLEEFIGSITGIFSDFNKKSYMNYQKATILIGKEMAGIKDGLKAFSKDLIKIFDKNKDVLNLSKSISFIKLKLNQITQTDRILGGVNEEIMSLDEKITDKKEENKKLIEEIEKIKKSPSYLEHLNKQKKIKSLEEELKNDIFSLKQLLDFKALANFYHSFEKEMNVLKEYKENFKQAFQKDSGKNILSLLNESKLNNETTSEKIKQIKSKTEEIEKNKQGIKKDETQELYSKTTKIILEIGDLKTEKAREERRYERHKANEEESIDSLKQELGKMNIEVV